MFLHVGEYVPAEPEHPTQGAAGLRKLVGAAFAGCAAFAGTTEKVATARPATNRDEAFMAISHISGQHLPSRSESLCLTSKSGHWKFLQSGTILKF